MEWIFWAVLFTIAVVFQLQAVFRRNHWGMLTSSVRWLRIRVWGRLGLFPLWGWLTMHWFLEPLLPGGQGLWYTVGILGGLLLAIIVDYDDLQRTLDDLFTPDA